MHSLFGASKGAPDLAAQDTGDISHEWASFRGVVSLGRLIQRECRILVVPGESALTGGRYAVYGYKGKQVRDKYSQL